jgi:hypothetical protein
MIQLHRMPREPADLIQIFIRKDSHNSNISKKLAGFFLADLDLTISFIISIVTFSTFEPLHPTHLTVIFVECSPTRTRT